MNQIAPSSFAEYGASIETPRTSLTHPINVSRIFPDELLSKQNLLLIKNSSEDLLDYLMTPIKFSGTLHKNP